MKPNTVGRAMEQISRPELSGPATRADSQTNGLLAGTCVWTLDGEMPVEFLASGDRIITRDTGMAILQSVQVIEVEAATVRIKAGSFGHTRPEADLILPEGQRVHIRDWRAQALFGQKQAIVEARDLLDGNFISMGRVEKLRLIKLGFDRPHILYADGIEIESSDAVLQKAA